MAFSFRSFFGKDKSDDQPTGHSSMMSSPQAQQGGYPFHKAGPSGAFSTNDVFLGASTPANGHTGQIHGVSPFSPAVSVPSTGLTVEDILPSLPPEVVKQPGVPPGQPLQIPNELLERVLRSGQAALPLFEIFRVCPALFRAPISPQDPRLVALPYHKLGGLAALAKKNGAAAPGPTAPSFGTAPAADPFVSNNPFQQSPEPPATAEPAGGTPLFNPSPFNLGESPFATLPAPAPQAAPVTQSAEAAPASPAPFFGAVGSLPFGEPQPAPPQTSLPPAVASNPFAPSQVFTASTSPFGGAPTLPGNLFAPSGQNSPSFPVAPQEPGPVPPLPAFTFSAGFAPSGKAQPPAPMEDTPPVPAPAALPPNPFGSFLNEPFSQGAGGPPAQSAPSNSATNPFFQFPSSASESTGAVPGPANNPFTNFGKAAPVPSVESGKLPPSITPPPAATPLFPTGGLPSGAAPWAMPGAPASVPAAPPEPAPLTFPEAPSAPFGVNPFDRIKALASVAEPAAPLVEPSATPTPTPSLSGIFLPASGPAPTPVAPGTPPPFNPPAASGPVSGAEKVTISLATALSRCSEQDIGVNPERIPSWIQVSLPVATLTSQLASGRITVRIVEIMRGLEPEFRNVISPSRGDLVVDIPVNDVFHALPTASAEPAPPMPAPVSWAPPEPPPVVKPASTLGAEALDAMANLRPSLPANSPESQAALPSLFISVRPEENTAKLPTGVPWPFELAAPATTPEPAPPVGDNAGFSGPASLFAAFATDDPPALSPAFHHAPAQPPEVHPLFQVNSPPVPAEAPVSPRAINSQSISFAPGIKAEFSQPPATPPPAFVAPIRTANDRNKQLLLRVLLGTEEDMELGDIIRLTGALPGVSAAVCLHNGTVINSASNHSVEAENFVRQAPQIYQHLQPLIQLTGIMDTETLSMKSDQLMASFSLQGEMVLGVLHDPGKNEPTLRERITLIARELKSVITAES